MFVPGNKKNSHTSQHHRNKEVKSCGPIKLNIIARAHNWWSLKCYLNY